MTRVMAVAFERHGQLHYLDPGDRDYAIGDRVRYPTADGPEVAEVVWGPQGAAAEQQLLPRCEGLATQADLARDEVNRLERAQGITITKRVVASHDLPMKVLAVDFLDRDPKADRLFAIYYTAPSRVDFRALLPDLARALNARVDLRQVGSRDAARLVGDVGSCGRDLCCVSFLDEIEPVSQRLARVQSVDGNPLQIAGACGRLKCCLRYEQPTYVDFLRRAPSLGEKVVLSDGTSGTVVGHQVPADQIRVRTSATEVIGCPLESVCSRGTRNPSAR